MFLRLQGVKSDYDATKLLQKTSASEIHKKRLMGFSNGKAKKDPLFEKHQLHETFSKKKLQTLQTMNRLTNRDHAMEFSSSPGRSELTAQ